ncbi:MAG TPA: FAD-dependent oxidoreductase [Allosphingosinicella sp.]|jgi:glycine/D-amino acid oxidase-like deaminating enzyme
MIESPVSVFAHPLLPRRRFLGSGAAAAASLALPGCATTTAGTGPVIPLAGACLAPVQVSRGRIIRELVGLRPYRNEGFVVRAEALGPKRLVHNYGHGGAGITLSWGSARLAAQLGLQGHQGPVAIVGCGVIGLTTARLVQEAGFPVTIYAQALPPETTSNIAGGQWLPTSYYDHGATTPEWRALNDLAIGYSYRRFQIMVGDDYGVRWVTQYFEVPAPPTDLPPGVTITTPTQGSPTQPDWRMLDRSEHPFPFQRARRHRLMMIEPGRFLRKLMEDVQIAGGKIAVRSFDSPAQLVALPERLIFNCTGLGSRALFGDESLYPIRGQLVMLLPQREVDYALGFQHGGGGYMFPRPDGIVLGGTYERNNWSTDPDPATTDRLIAQHRQVFDHFRCDPGGGYRPSP